MAEDKIEDFIDTYSRHVYSIFGPYYLTGFVNSGSLANKVAASVAKEKGMTSDDVKEIIGNAFEWISDQIFDKEGNDFCMKDSERAEDRTWNPDKNKLPALLKKKYGYISARYEKRFPD